MRSTAFPIRVAPDGTLAQGEAFDGVLAMIRVMAGTSTRAWPHAPWFGLYESFIEAAQRDRQDHEGLKDAINNALKRLGVTDYLVQALATGAFAPDGRRQFRITMVGPDGRSIFGEMAAG